jgi:hypothetical protein
LKPVFNEEGSPTKLTPAGTAWVPRLQWAGRDAEPHSFAEQYTIADGRLIPAGKGFVRKPRCFHVVPRSGD